MASQPLPGIRWGRALIAAFVAEVALAALTFALIYATGNAQAYPTQLLNWTIPPASLVVFVAAGWWTAKAALPGTELVNGAMPGLWGVVLYVVLTLVASGATADFDLESSVRPAYLLAHTLKVIGGLIGGWLVARKAAA